MRNMINAKPLKKMNLEHTNSKCINRIAFTLKTSKQLSTERESKQAEDGFNNLEYKQTEIVCTHLVKQQLQICDATMFSK